MFIGSLKGGLKYITAMVSLIWLNKYRCVIKFCILPSAIGTDSIYVHKYENIDNINKIRRKCWDIFEPAFNPLSEH